MIREHCGKRLIPQQGVTEDCKTKQRWHTWHCSGCSKIFTQRVRQPRS